MSGRGPGKTLADRDRIPRAMFCALYHIGPTLRLGLQGTYIGLARHAHDAGCGSFPSQPTLAKEVGASRVSVRKYLDGLLRARYQDDWILDRLPRVCREGGDLYRLRLCRACRRDLEQARCARCREENLLHDETEWWAAARGLGRPDSRQRSTRADRCGAGQLSNPLPAEVGPPDPQLSTRVDRKEVGRKGEPAAIPDHLQGQAAPGARRQPADPGPAVGPGPHGAEQPGKDRPHPERGVPLEGSGSVSW